MSGPSYTDQESICPGCGSKGRRCECAEGDAKDARIAALEAEVAEQSEEIEALSSALCEGNDELLRRAKEIAELRAERDALRARNAKAQCAINDDLPHAERWARMSGAYAPQVADEYVEALRDVLAELSPTADGGEREGGSDE